MNRIQTLYRDFFRLKIDESETKIKEAQLINQITDFRGGVEYAIREPKMAIELQKQIKIWCQKKGISIVDSKLSRTGKIGYMLFRVDRSNVSEIGQRIQGYFSSKPEIKHFRFRVRK